MQKNKVITVQNLPITIFKVFESEHFKKQAGLLNFTPSVRINLDVKI